ncbi:MAG: hypothetical protein AAFP88_02125 [Bacteroidota bacterium]
MKTLLVRRGLEQSGKIGPFYVHEVALLGISCLVFSFVVLFLRATLHISLGWFLSAPSLAAVALIFARAWRQGRKPYLTRFMALFSLPATKIYSYQ